MELGGFARHTVLDTQQRGDMFTPECANLVIWNLWDRVETADQGASPMNDAEGEE